MKVCLALRQAKENGELQYFTGKPCNKGHIANRLVSSRACMECSKEKETVRRSLNPEKLKEINKKSKDKYRIAIRAYDKKRYQENKPAQFARNAKRRATKLNATPKWLTKEQHAEMREFYEMAKELEKVFPWKQHVDHIVPLVNDKVCGLHAPWNLQILSAKANLEKHNNFEVV